MQHDRNPAEENSTHVDEERRCRVTNKCQSDQGRAMTDGISRRSFLKIGGTILVGVGLGEVLLPPGIFAMPVSGGYLLIDTYKCAGCLSCMMACSLSHKGEANLSLSAIQIVRNPLLDAPDDIEPQQCRQCVDPMCVRACPTGALTPDARFGNVRRVDHDKCIGCEACFNACPFTPSRAVFDFINGVAQKCDLCADTPHWKNSGGPDGLQACREICPMKAIGFTKVVPDQTGNAGYWVNLRKARIWGPEHWAEWDVDGERSEAEAE